MPDNLIESGRAGAHAACAHVSPAPLYHSVRWVCPSTVGSAAFYREPFRLAAFDPRSASLRPPHLMSRRYYPLAGAITLRLSVAGQPAAPTGPWLNPVCHVRVCCRYYGLRRQSLELPPGSSFDLSRLTQIYHIFTSL